MYSVVVPVDNERAEEHARRTIYHCSHAIEVVGSN